MFVKSCVSLVLLYSIIRNYTNGSVNSRFNITKNLKIGLNL